MNTREIGRTALVLLGCLALAGCDRPAMTTAQMKAKMDECAKAGMDIAPLVERRNPGVVVEMQCYPKSALTKASP